MSKLERLPYKDEQGHVHVVVEAPRGSLVKLKYEPQLRAFVFNRALELGVVYPYDWGFVPSTLADDGDPLDAMVLFDAPTAPGVVIPSRPLGVVCIKQTEDGETVRNDRVIAVPCDDERYEDVGDVGPNMREQLEHFFVVAAQPSKKKIQIEGWRDDKAAWKCIEEAARAYQKKNG